jgi:NADH dehydrogenase FAD-containing subunit
LPPERRERGRLKPQRVACCATSGRVKVEADCTLPGHPEVFVIGDVMSSMISQE